MLILASGIPGPEHGIGEHIKSPTLFSYPYIKKNVIPDTGWQSGGKECVRMDTSLLVAISSLLGAAIGGFFTYLAGKETKKISNLNDKLTKTRKELLEIYQDLSQLNQVKDKYREEANLSRHEINEQFPTSARSYPSKIKTRIQDLMNQL